MKPCRRPPKSLAAVEILVEVSPEAVNRVVEKSGEDPAALDHARRQRLSSTVAEHAVLDFARTELPVTSRDYYDYHIDPVTNPQLITSRMLTPETMRERRRSPSRRNQNNPR